MKLDIKKGNVPVSYIQCGSWSSTNLNSDGLSMEISQEGGKSIITFHLDTSINQKTKNKETSTYLDSMQIIDRADDFQYLTFSDTAIVRMLSPRMPLFQNKDKTKCLLEIKLNSEGLTKKIAVYPSVSNEVKLTKI
jgi:hypothetical protein